MHPAKHSIARDARQIMGRFLRPRPRLYPPPRSGAAQTKNPVLNGVFDRRVLVAGAGFEPTTFGL